jgi:hypothetical protein
MSKERELLERWLDDTIFEPEELDSLMEETRELLAQPEQASTARHALDSYWESESYQRGYAQAELDLKPELSDEQKRLAAIAIKQREAHGIGGGE